MTRVEAQDEILETVGPWLLIFGPAATADESGVIASLNSALRAGFAYLGLSLPSRVVTDEDMGRIPAADEDRFLDAARYHVLNTTLIRWVKPNERQNTTSQDWGSLLGTLRGQVDILGGILGLGVPTLGIGSMNLGIMEPAESGDEFA